MRNLTILFIALMLIISLHAKWDMDWSDGNQLNLAITNYGILGHNVLLSTAGGYWPAGYPGENYVYGSGLWFGALVDTTGNGDIDTLVTAGYNPSSGVCEFSPGDGDDAPLYTDPYDIVYRSDEAEWHSQYAPDTKPDSIISILDTWAMYSDLDPSAHFTSENKPLGLLVKQTTYALPGPITEDIVIVQFCVKNVNPNGYDLEKCYIGFSADLDIGNESGTSANDLLGFIDTMTVDYAGVNDTLMQINTGYQFQLDAEGGWAHTPGIASIIFLESPIATDSIDLYHDGSFIIPEGNPIGMTTFNYFTIDTDPATKEERYQLLAGYNHLSFNPADPEASYRPFPDWGEGTAGYPGQSQASYTAGDKRFVMASGPFDIDYGDSIFFVAAYSVSPDTSSLLQHSLATINLWNNSLKNVITVYAPADSAEISSFTDFTWSPFPDKDSFHISLSDVRDTFIYEFNGINNGTYSMNTISVPDGFYDWYINNYNYMYYESHSCRRRVIVNNSNMNCRPYIENASSDIISDRAYLSWTVSDPEDDSILTHVSYVRNATLDTAYSYSTYGNSLSFSAYNYLPDGSYTVILAVEDDSSAVDTMRISQSYTSTRPSEPGIKISGDNDYVDIEIITYNVDSLKSHMYSLDFDFPYIDNSCIYLPFTVTDMNTSSIVLTNTAGFYLNTYTPYDQIFYSDVFDGIGLKVNFDSILTDSCIYDSVRVITDVGTAYPESLLHISTEHVLLAGRDLDMYWHHNGDSIYAEIIPSFYSDSLEYCNPVYDDSYQYRFGSAASPSVYLNSSSISRTLMYAAGASIGFNYSGRYYAMDTLWFPEEGEVWRVYSSGRKVPIKGDSYMFSPSGIVNKQDIVPALFLSVQNSVSSGILQYSIVGIGEVDLNLYDVTGRKVMNLFTGSINGMKALSNQLTFPSGIYFMKDCKNKSLSKKLILIQ